MVDITWKLFSQTGNIETYLLMKELENATLDYDGQAKESTEVSSTETNI
ncbi:YqzL family protein [Oceanobacillus sp. 1P07AA]